MRMEARACAWLRYELKGERGLYLGPRLGGGEGLTKDSLVRSPNGRMLAQGLERSNVRQVCIGRCAHDSVLRAGFVLWPVQERTGKRGYLGKLGSVADSSHRMKTEPREDSMRRA
jgi:hypothetical protein